MNLVQSIHIIIIQVGSADSSCLPVGVDNNPPGPSPVVVFVNDAALFDLVAIALALLEIDTFPGKEPPFASLPSLNAGKEEDDDNKNNDPLPRDADVLEHARRQARDIQEREQHHKTADDGEEEKFVGVDGAGPSRDCGARGRGGRRRRS